jgi:hypothetical protein
MSFGHRVLVAGAGGALGAAVMQALLASPGIERVGALASRPMGAALHSFAAVTDDDASIGRFEARTAVVVFDRARHAQGREDAFVRPEPAGLPALAARLLTAGAKTLLVVVPHAPSLLPLALQQGLASLDEAAVAALGFDHLVFMRMAQAAGEDRSALEAPRRLARWMLSQLRWMIPQREQPVRAETVAAVTAALVRQLTRAAAGTRVLPTSVLWQAAQRRDADAVVAQWLAG